MSAADEALPKRVPELCWEESAPEEQSAAEATGTARQGHGIFEVEGELPAPEMERHRPVGLLKVARPLFEVRLVDYHAYSPLSWD